MIVSKFLHQHKFKHNHDFQSFLTQQPSFIKILDEVEISSEKERIKKFLLNYDFANSKDICNEKAFTSTIRIIPAIEEIVGNLDRNAPYSDAGFEFDEELLASIRSIISKFIVLFESSTGEKWKGSSVCLSVLGPGEVLRPHVDGYVAHKWAEKIHIPIISNEYCSNTKTDINFQIHEFDNLDVDSNYIINNMDPHSAINFGKEYRTHLIFDLLPINYLKTIRSQLPNNSDNIYRIQSECAKRGNAVFHKALDKAFVDKDDYNSIRSFYKKILYE